MGTGGESRTASVRDGVREREMGTNDRKEELRRWTTVEKSAVWHCRWALVHRGQLFIIGIKAAQFLCAAGCNKMSDFMKIVLVLLIFLHEL